MNEPIILKPIMVDFTVSVIFKQEGKENESISLNVYSKDMASVAKGLQMALDHINEKMDTSIFSSEIPSPARAMKKKR